MNKEPAKPSKVDQIRALREARAIESDRRDKIDSDIARKRIADSKLVAGAALADALVRTEASKVARRAKKAASGRKANGRKR